MKEKAIIEYPRIVATNETDSFPHPAPFETVHQEGIPHRVVHIEILNNSRLYFIWERFDGRFEIIGGHVDWMEEKNRAESYEEAALREIVEELNLCENWDTSREQAIIRLKGWLIPITRIVNQIPSSFENNNEWVSVYALYWQTKWGDPTNFKLSQEGSKASWLNINEIVNMCIKNPMKINSALRIFLRRHNVLIPLIKSKGEEHERQL